MWRTLNKEMLQRAGSWNHQEQWTRDFLPETNQGLIKAQAFVTPAHQALTAVETNNGCDSLKLPSPDTRVRCITCPSPTTGTCVCVLMEARNMHPSLVHVGTLQVGAPIWTSSGRRVCTKRRLVFSGKEMSKYRYLVIRRADRG